MAAVKLPAKADKSVNRQGHVLAHGIGIRAYGLNPRVAGNFENCPQDFSSGCAHGVIQAHLESQATVTGAALDSLCAPYRGGHDQWRLFQCVHGAGHGLVMMHRGDLPKALDLCDAMTDGWDRDSCYGGAFMENIMGAISPHHPATELTASHGEHHGAFMALDSTDLLYPCSKMATRYLRACYDIQTAAILHFTKGKIEPASAACQTAPADLRPTCFSSLGRDISAKALRNPRKSLNYCNRAEAEYRPWCYCGLAKALVDWDADPVAGFRLCAIVGDSVGANACYQAVAEQIASLTAAPDRRDQWCDRASTTAGRALCRRVNGLPVEGG